MTYHIANILITTKKLPTELDINDIANAIQQSPNNLTIQPYNLKIENDPQNKIKRNADHSYSFNLYLLAELTEQNKLKALISHSRGLIKYKTSIYLIENNNHFSIANSTDSHLQDYQLIKNAHATYSYSQPPSFLKNLSNYFSTLFDDNKPNQPKTIIYDSNKETPHFDSTNEFNQ